jgi:hypothetical protein
MALLWLLCVFFVLSLCQAYIVGSNVQSVRLQKQSTLKTCTSMSVDRRGLLQGAAAGLIGTLAIAEPVLAITKPKRKPVARLPEGMSYHAHDHHLWGKSDCIVTQTVIVGGMCANTSFLCCSIGLQSLTHHN